jgi:hypothetical protein
MDRLSSVMVRVALVWLVTGVIVGGAMLSDGFLPGDWRLWFGSTHPHMLFVGWFLQFTLGVAYWLLPRRRSTARPLGYDQSLAFAAVIGLNLGLVLRVIAEPLERSGRASEATMIILGLSALAQVVATLIFVAQLWARAAARPNRQAQASSA